MFPDPFRLYWDTAAKHPRTLAEAILAQNIAVPNGTGTTNERVAANLDTIFEKLSSYTERTNPQGSERDLIRDAILMAQTDFAWLDCRAPRSEDSLTGSLLSRLSSSVMAINGLTGAGRQHQPIGLWSIELIRRGREQRLGGDLAVVLESDRQLFAACLQAKRADPQTHPTTTAMASISQPKSEFDENDRVIRRYDHLWQLRRLREASIGLGNRISAAYVFYNNGEAGTAEPIFPLAKDIHRLEPNVDAVRRTDINRGTVDLASYIFGLMGNSELAISSDPESLYALARLLSDSNFRHIVYVGSSVDFVLRLRQSFEAMNPADTVFSDLIPGDRGMRKQFAPKWPDDLPEPDVTGYNISFQVKRR